MTDERISQLSPGTTMSGTEPIPMVQNGVTVSCNAGMIKAYLGTQTDPVINGNNYANATIYSNTFLTPASNLINFVANYIAVTDTGALNTNPYGKTLRVDMLINGPITGSRAAAIFSTQVNATTANTIAGPSTTYGCLNANVVASVNDNGTGVTSTTSHGGISASNFTAKLLAGATNYFQCVGNETDIDMEFGSSAFISRGYTVTKLTTAQARGTGEDSAIAIASQNPNVFMTVGTVTVDNAGNFNVTGGANFVVGATFKVIGGYTGAGRITGYVNPSLYKIASTDGSSTFTLTDINNNPVATTAGSLSGLTFNADWGGYGWKFGIALGTSPSALFPFAWDATLIPSGVGYCTAGVDLSLTTFKSFAYKSNGYQVDPVGNVTAQNVAVTPTIAPTVDAGNVGYVRAQTGLAMMIAPTGTMANNGAITLGTAAPTTYANCYVYLPANAIVAGSAAGWYFAQFTTTTAGTVFNNTWTVGTPTIPTSPTPFVTVGPGAYTGVTSTQNAGNCFVIGGTLGLNGGVEVDGQWTCNNSAGTKTVNVKFGGNIISTVQATTQTNGVTQAVIRNRGVTGSQYGSGYHTAQAAVTLQSAGAIYPSVDTTANVFVVIGLTLATATDVVVLESFSVKVFPN